jgi:uncharacterized membrane protein YccC
MLALRAFQSKLSALLRSFARRRPNWMVAFAIEEANLSEGMRAACASTAMLLLGMCFGKPEFAWAAIGAFWTCLADASGSSRTRLASMLSFSMLSTVFGGITAYAAGVSTFAAAGAILIFATIAGLARIWSTAAYQVAILAATACVVMVDNPLHDLAKGAIFLGIYLGGCLFATLLSFTVWRIHRFAPSRYALRLAYSRLAELSLDNARLIDSCTTDTSQWVSHATELRAQSRASIEAVRRALHNLPRLSMDSSRQVYQYLLLALADAERIFASLIAVAHVEEGKRPDTFRPTRAARCLAAIAEILKRMGEQLGDTSGSYPYALRERLPVFARYLEAAFGQSLSLPFWSEDVPHLSPRTNEHWLYASLAVVRRALDVLKDHVSIRSVNVQYAVRLGIATMTAFLVVRALHVHYGYWATMAVLLTLQPSVATTWPRGVERAVGSTLGALLAIAIGHFVHTPLAISLAVFLTICLTMSLRPVSYSLFVIFLTPSFVLVADYAAPASEYAYAMARLGNNILGCAIALLATYLLWPHRDTKNLHIALVEAVRANLAHLAAALTPDDADDSACEAARRQAGLSSNSAEHFHRLVRMEGRRRDGTAVTMVEVLPLLRRIAGTATQARARTDRSEDTGALAAWISATSDNLVAHLRGEDLLSQQHPFSVDGLSPVEATVVKQVLRLSHLLSFGESVGGAGTAQSSKGRTSHHTSCERDGNTASPL